MDFLGRFPQQEQAAGDQDQVADREGRLEARLAMRIESAGQAEVEHRHGHAGDPRDGRQQAEAQDQRQADADAADLDPLVLGQLVRQDRDEDEVVDAEHHLHHDQGGERRPGGGVGKERDEWTYCGSAASPDRGASELCRISDEFIRRLRGITLHRLGDAIGLAFEQPRGFSSSAGRVDMAIWASREDEQGMSFDKGRRGDRGGRGRDKRDGFGGDDFGGGSSFGGGDRFGGGGDRFGGGGDRLAAVAAIASAAAAAAVVSAAAAAVAASAVVAGGGGRGMPPQVVGEGTGVVKFFNGQKGFGFVVRDDGGEDVFVHISAVEQAGLTGLAEGQPLGFTLVDRGGRISATDLKIEGEPFPSLTAARRATAMRVRAVRAVVLVPAVPVRRVS